MSSLCLSNTKISSGGVPYLFQSVFRLVRNSCQLLGMSLTEWAFSTHVWVVPVQASSAAKRRTCVTGFNEREVLSIIAGRLLSPI